MSDPRDLARHLPLSMRPRLDESAVTGDWGPRLAMLLRQFAELLTSLSPAARAAVRGQVGRAVAATAPRGQRGDLDTLDDDALIARIRQLADRIEAEGRVTRVRVLGAVLVEAYEAADVAGQPIEVDPVTSGAVALAQSLRAPTAIRAVVRGRTLRSTDAGWEFGSGPEIAGTAAALVLFLYGRAGVP